MQLEDPYLTNRDSRTDIKIRPSSVRKREALDLGSDYLPTKSLQATNGANPKRQYTNYYNTSPSGSGSQPSGKVCSVLVKCPAPCRVDTVNMCAVMCDTHRRCESLSAAAVKGSGD